MAEEKLTTRAEDFSEWYNQLVVRADLADYALVRGCMVVKPYGWALWENITSWLDAEFACPLAERLDGCRDRARLFTLIAFVEGAGAAVHGDRLSLSDEDVADAHAYDSDALHLEMADRPL